MDRSAVADVLLEISTMLELKGENPFKSRAYNNAARAIETMEESLEKVIAENRLHEVKGIGEAIQKKVIELVTTGKLVYYEELRASIPAGLFEMLQIPGVGPKKMKALWDKLGITTVDQLEQACKDGRVAELSGFGEKTQTNVCEGITRRRTYAERHLLSAAIVASEPILESLRGHPDIIRCGIAGSLRRFKEVIGDVDFVVSSKNPSAVIEYFCGLAAVAKVVARGDTKASVILQGGIQSDLRVVSDAEFPFALLYFTGSKEHNIVMRQRAIQRDLRLNEYGLFRSKEETRDPALAVPCRTEEEAFAALDLAFIPPEVREDMGEFKAAENGPLPRLIEWTDLKGALHNHSVWSDGKHRLEEISDYMDDLGFEYWGITNHSKSSWQANGLDVPRLRQESQAIKDENRRLEDKGTAFRLLSGIEVDILIACTLDLPDDVLAELDVVVASIHQGFGQGEAENTKRLICAAQNPYVHMLGHPSGRLLLHRDAYKVNMHAVIDACAETGTWIELNSSPNRFDMDWRFWPYAKSKGVKCVINCDGHRNEHTGYLRLGAGVARKGWLTKDDVINTLPLPQLRDALKAKRNRS